MLFIVDQYYEFQVVRLFLTALYVVLINIECSSSSLVSTNVRYWIYLGWGLGVLDVVFLVVFLRSIIHARLLFQDLVFGDLTSMFSFTVWERLSILLQFSLLLGSLVALPYAMFATLCLDNVFLHVCYVVWKVVFDLKLGLWFFGGWLPFFLLRVISFLPLYRCMELVSWSFGPLYP